MAENGPKLPRPKDTIFSTALYQPGRPLEEVLAEFGLDRAHKLASNENLFGSSPRALAALREAVDGVNYYPDTNCVLLGREIAADLGVAPEEVVLGNGTVELIYDLIRAYIGPGTSIVVGAPSFTAYPIATRIEGGEVLAVPLDASHTLDLDAMAAAIREDTRLVFLPNPNNPTGTMFPADALDRFLARVPEGVLVVLDEAYHDYLRGSPGYPDSVALFRAGHPVCILRSLSKSLGIAGLRIGYGVFPPEVARSLRQVQVPFHCSGPAQAAARAGLADQEFLEATREALADAREHLYRRLEGLDLEYVPSFANFVMIRLDDPRGVARALMARGLIVRPGEDLGAPGWLRITVGPREIMDVFADALGEVLASATPAAASA